MTAAQVATISRQTIDASIKRPSGDCPCPLHCRRVDDRRFMPGSSATAGQVAPGLRTRPGCTRQLRLLHRRQYGRTVTGLPTSAQHSGGDLDQYPAIRKGRGGFRHQGKQRSPKPTQRDVSRDRWRAAFRFNRRLGPGAPIPARSSGQCAGLGGELSRRHKEPPGDFLNLPWRHGCRLAKAVRGEVAQIANSYEVRNSLWS